VVGAQFQGGAAVREVLAVETLQPNDVQVVQSTRFSNNQTRLGPGEVPLPAVLPP
jgi:hypothetical protein